jgi:hypothetical protein
VQKPAAEASGSGFDDVRAPRIERFQRANAPGAGWSAAAILPAFSGGALVMISRAMAAVS